MEHLDIVSGELLTVMPLDIAAEFKGVSEGSIVIGPALSQAGNGISVLVQLYQGVEQQMFPLLCRSF